jgi:uncharacterized protein (TIGR00299 family) protein
LSKTILYLDPFSGISGDMFVGALLDLGLDLAKLHFELSKLNVAGYHLGSRRVMRGALAAIKFDVTLDVPAAQTAARAETTHDHGHSHGEHGHEHGHDHGHSHGGGDASADGHVHRTFADIRRMIEASALSAAVKRNSISAFQKLAVAEGRMHDLPPEQVGFHEVGAIDSIVDMVGVCIGLDVLGVDEVWCGPIALGSGGFVKCDHGQMPVPAPATLELMKGLPVRETDFKKELTTPTGAALAAALVTRFCPLPAMTIQKLGYGAGTRESQPMPNILRVALGTVESSEAASRDTTSSDTVIEISANLDDTTPEVIGYLCETLFARGALDVFLTPIQMKKFRPGTMLTVLAEPAQLDSMAETIFRECPTFGLRYQTYSRLKLTRRIETVETQFGPVRVKIGQWQGRDTSIHPEYEDCRARALEKGVAVREVIEAAKRKFTN